MKKEDFQHKFDSLTDLHQLFGLPNPLHPLICLIDNMDNRLEVNKLPHTHILNYYKISYNTKFSRKIKYG